MNGVATSNRSIDGRTIITATSLSLFSTVVCRFATVFASEMDVMRFRYRYTLNIPLVRLLEERTYDIL